MHWMKEKRHKIKKNPEKENPKRIVNMIEKNP